MTTISISKIAEGTVIDHIEPGIGIQIYELLNLKNHGAVVTLGLNLKSEKMGLKDLIKIEGRILSPEDLELISLFAPRSTITLIQKTEITQKYKVPFPSEVKGLFDCKNRSCISHHEIMKPSFKIYSRYKTIELECGFCLTKLNLNEASVKRPK